MSDLASLRNWCSGLDPLDTDATVDTLPPQGLRFVLEFQSDPDLDATRAHLASLINTNAFHLTPLFADSAPDDEDGVFVLLEFPGLERTMSPRSLYQVAYALADEFDLLSCEPDMGADVFVEPFPAADAVDAEGVVKDALASTCWVDIEPPADRQWALDKLRVHDAWTMSPQRGAGIRIAQPDTGIAQHVELDAPRLDLDSSANFVEGGTDPTDPLSDEAANPGHGTGTASVAISEDAGDMIGSAPGATLIPIRAITDVKVFNGAPVAKSIDHARVQGCDVITMSLGGTPSRAVKHAVKRAVRAGMIIVSAAGNCVRTVVWPARYDKVIAIGGCNVNDVPWRGSSRGGAVDICAPAEQVWRARRQPDSADVMLVEPGQGTSFATALTAGVAALWLAHHGKDAVKAAAAAQGLSVQELFRQTLTDTARIPPDWNHSKFGAGIVDARALLEADIDGGPMPEGAGGPGAVMDDASDALRDLLREVTGADTAADALDWRRYGAELGGLLLDDAQHGVFESANPKAFSQRPMSEQLQHALDAAAATANDAATVLRSRPTRTAFQPLLQAAVSAERVKLVAANAGTPLESTRNLNVEQARATLDAPTVQRKLDRLSESLGGLSANDRAAVLGGAERVLERLRDGNDAVAVNASDEQIIEATVSLEALVKLEGRPVLEITDAGIDLNDPALGAWQAPIVLAAQDIETKRKSVGRIDTGVEHAGTGFVVAPGLIMTNRHVLEALAAPIPRARNPERWFFEEPATINFAPDALGDDRRFAITGVRFSGPDPISRRPIRFRKLDMALLEVETSNAAGAQLPPPLGVTSVAGSMDTASPLFVLGYPAQPSVLPKDDEGKLIIEVVQRLRELYGMRYGVQYLSVGEVMQVASAVPGSPKDWVFSHDATSLGGNSGSCVLTLDGEVAVAGLHFAGDWLRANYAHDLPAVLAQQALPELG